MAMKKNQMSEFQGGDPVPPPPPQPPVPHPDRPPRR